MTPKPHPWASTARPALVLLWERAFSPLWDPGLSALVDELEDRLEHVHATYATMDGNHPTPDDALAAVRSMGSTAAVVVVPEEWQRSGLAPWLPHSETGGVPVMAVRCRWRGDAIARAYLDAEARLAAVRADEARTRTEEAARDRRHTA